MIRRFEVTPVLRFGEDPPVHVVVEVTMPDDFPIEAPDLLALVGTRLAQSKAYDWYIHEIREEQPR